MTRVIIVDDQPGFRCQLRALLERAGLIVVGEADDIPDAESKTHTLHPDLAIVDMMLPGINGVDGTMRLKAIAPHLRVILVSAHVDHINLFHQAARNVGAEMFIAKDNLDLEMVRSWNSESRGDK